MSAEFVALGLGRFVRADRVLALEPITGERRGPGSRTLVWVEGLPDPLVASRSEQAILAALGGVVRRPTARGERDERPRRAPDPPPSLF